MKHVRVRLHGGLERYIGTTGEVDLRVDDHTSLAALQDLLGVPRGEAGLFVVGEKLLGGDALVEDNSTVDIYPAFGGG